MWEGAPHLRLPNTFSYIVIFLVECGQVLQWFGLSYVAPVGCKDHFFSVWTYGGFTAFFTFFFIDSLVGLCLDHLEGE